jgi:hypothetical protein
MKKSLALALLSVFSIVTSATSARAQTQLSYGTFQRGNSVIYIIGAMNRRQLEVEVSLTFRPAGCQSGVWNFLLIWDLPRNYGGAPVFDNKENFSGTVVCNGGDVTVHSNPGSGGYMEATFTQIDSNQLQFTVVETPAPGSNFSSFSGVYTRVIGRPRKHGALTRRRNRTSGVIFNLG